ncbi:MAG: hypothetical protein LBE57_04820 [Methanosarcinales archaeon]|jgi:uncharacterized BrkB/YihY/UPF0761 family membrane protein|nr:hypothetical protein [Methanosarcinales archaeon]
MPSFGFIPKTHNSLPFGSLFKNTRKNLKELAHDESGVSITGSVIEIATFVITLALIVMVLAMIEPQVVGSSNQSNATIANIFETTWSALGLYPVVIFVMIIGIIIGAVYMFMPRTN